MKYTHEAIFCIVNAGFSDLVMDTARKLGAKGGTVIHARGTASPDAEKLFGVSVLPDKEIVMIVVPKALRDGVLRGLYDNAGLSSDGAGIAFSVPVDATAGFAEEE